MCCSRGLLNRCSLVTLFAVTLFRTIQETAAGSACGYHSNPEHRALLQDTFATWDAEHLGSEQINNDTTTTRRRLNKRGLTTTIDYNIRMVIHVIGSDEASADALTPERQATVLSWLENAFGNTNFTFELRGTRAHVDAELYDCDTRSGNPTVNIDITRKYNIGNKATLNMYFCNQQATLGYASVGAGIPGDGVFIDHWDNFVGRGAGEDENLLEMIVVHETGHWLGLDHTFETGICPSNQKTNYSNPCTCDPVNDGIQDTPAHSRPSRDLSHASDCFRDENGEFLETLPDTCPGLPGKDPIDNWMNYPHLSCARLFSFTRGQINAMKALWQRTRFVAPPNPGVTKAAAWRLLSNHVGTQSSRFLWAIDKLQFYSDVKCSVPVNLAAVGGATAITAFGTQLVNDSNVFAFPSHSSVGSLFDEDDSTFFAMQALEDPWFGLQFPTDDVQVLCGSVVQLESFEEPDFASLGIFEGTYTTTMSLQARQFGNLVWETVSTVRNLQPGPAAVANEAAQCVALVRNKCGCRREVRAKKCRKLRNKGLICHDRQPGCACEHRLPDRCVRKRLRSKKCRNFARSLNHWSQATNFKCTTANDDEAAET